MPAKIPVQVGANEFDSLNKARLHYREILYSYKSDEKLSDNDRKKISELRTESAPANFKPLQAEEIRVVKGKYGRSHFKVRLENASYETISIIGSVKRCAKSEFKK